MSTHDPLRAAVELREQLASEKRRLAFFLGAGTSMAVGLPGIRGLTEMVLKKLAVPQGQQCKNIKSELKAEATIEDVLDRIRLYRELLEGSEEKEYAGIKGTAAARKLDAQVCQLICEAVSADPKKGFRSHLIFAQWLRALHSRREFPVEVFTTNYDLLLERAMEELGVPFFDGFVGSVAPFFVPESVEAEMTAALMSYPPRDWTRLWKIHGSTNWYITRGAKSENERITRLSGTKPSGGQELVIFPSREKYTESRKLPFIAYQDRLRRLLSGGECLMLILGYNFSDDHLNEIIFQGLRSNPRLAVVATTHSDLPARLTQYATDHRNLTIYGPDKAAIGGIVGPWIEPSRQRRENENWPFWNEKGKRFTLGDFESFASFLELFIGFRLPALVKEDVSKATALGEAEKVE